MSPDFEREYSGGWGRAENHEMNGFSSPSCQEDQKPQTKYSPGALVPKPTWAISVPLDGTACPLHQT